MATTREWPCSIASRPVLIEMKSTWKFNFLQFFGVGLSVSVRRNSLARDSSYVCPSNIRMMPPWVCTCVSVRRCCSTSRCFHVVAVVACVSTRTPHTAICRFVHTNTESHPHPSPSPSNYLSPPFLPSPPPIGSAADDLSYRVHPTRDLPLPQQS